jgi:hypothetical protein
MRVMLCWSGKRGKVAATALRDWLPNVIQAIEPWMSEEDIEKGSRWETELDKLLANANFGILCITPESAKSLYIHYEAGALSKTLNQSYVCPYLIGLEPIDFKGPLTKFQATKANKEDTFRLIKVINNALPGGTIPEDRLSRTFEMWWPSLDQKISQVIKSPVGDEPKRSQEELTNELSKIIGAQSQILNKLKIYRGPDINGEKIRDLINTMSSEDEGRFTRNQKVQVRDGIEVFDDRLDLMKHYGDYILSAEKRVLIVGETLVTFIQYPRFKEVVKSTISRGVKVDVVLMSDKCPSLEERAFELGEEYEEMMASQQAAIFGWKSVMKFVESSNFNVFLIDYHPKMFIFHIDERVYFQPYPFGAYGTELPCLLAHPSSSAYDDLVSIEEKLMNASHKLVLSH